MGLGRGDGDEQEERSLRYFGTYGGVVLNLRQELFHSQIDRKRDTLEEFFNGVEEKTRTTRTTLRFLGSKSGRTTP